MAVAELEPTVAPGWAAVRVATGYPVVPEAATGHGGAITARRRGARDRASCATMDRGPEPARRGLRGWRDAPRRNRPGRRRPWTPEILDLDPSWPAITRTWGVTVQVDLPIRRATSSRRASFTPSTSQAATPEACSAWSPPAGSRPSDRPSSPSRRTRPNGRPAHRARHGIRAGLADAAIREVGSARGRSRPMDDRSSVWCQVWTACTSAPATAHGACRPGRAARPLWLSRCWARRTGFRQPLRADRAILGW